MHIFINNLYATKRVDIQKALRYAKCSSLNILIEREAD